MPIKSPPSRKRGEPAWEIARLFPDQGYWDEDEYLAIETNQLVEFTDGFIEVLPMPKTSHQRIVVFLMQALLAFAQPQRLGEVLPAPLRVRLRARKYREPDVVFMLSKNDERVGEDYWDRADLVMEVVSGEQEDRDRDYVEKRRDYAAAGIPEYWIVDPQEQEISVLQLRGNRYLVAGKYQPGENASSVLLKGFSVVVSEAFAAAKRK